MQAVVDAKDMRVGHNEERKVTFLPDAGKQLTAEPNITFTAFHSCLCPGLSANSEVKTITPRKKKKR